MTATILIDHEHGTRWDFGPLRKAATLPEFAGTTHITAVLDRSGSMGGQIEETCRAYNRWLADLKKASIGQDTSFTLKIFDDEHTYIHKDVPIRNAKKLTHKTYFARGMTALNDALGQEATYLARIVKAKDRAILLCMTDGLENASHEYDANRLRAAMRTLDKRRNVSIQFIGANFDAFQVGQGIGLHNNRGITRTNDYIGTQAAFASASAASASMLSGARAMNATITQDEYDAEAAKIAKNAPKKAK